MMIINFYEMYAYSVFSETETNANVNFESVFILITFLKDKYQAIIQWYKVFSLMKHIFLYYFAHKTEVFCQTGLNPRSTSPRTSSAASNFCIYKYNIYYEWENLHELHTDVIVTLSFQFNTCILSYFIFVRVFRYEVVMCIR